MDAELGRRESPGVATRRVVAAVAGILILLTLIALGFELLFQDRIGKTFTVHRPFPAPAVIADEQAQRLGLEAKQRRALAGGDGRMPIDGAMAAIAARGTHAFDPVGGTP
jgi:hypothetical protein